MNIFLLFSKAMPIMTDGMLVNVCLYPNQATFLTQTNGAASCSWTFAGKFFLLS